MKTKTIFKMLALAMLMPAMLLTTACSSDDDAIINNNETPAKKGYTLPVTINVTRQSEAATRATYTDNGNKTGSLSFSSGDKLFVTGAWEDDDENYYCYAGILDYVSDGTFSGTIITETEWTGTTEGLLGGASATLLPAGYGEYGYLSIADEGTYEAYLSENSNKAFATSKATAVEQFSYELDNKYSSGFELIPANAILNFTINGLEASKEVDVSFSYPNYPDPIVISGKVTTDGDGTATFAIGIKYRNNLNDCTLTVGGNAIALPADKEIKAGKIYNISKTIAASSSLTGQFSVSTTKKVCFSKGHLQATYDGTDWTWAFATNQWDYIGNAAGNTSINGNGTVSASNVTVDLFGWVGASNTTWTGAAQYGISNSNTTNSTSTYGNNASEALKSDWGNTIGSGWRTLTKDEWTYLFNTRTVNGGQGSGKSYTLGQSVNGKLGVVIYPDDYTGSVYAGSDWSTFEAAGCVFLPAAGNRSRASVSDAGSYGYYWSSSSTSSVDYAYYVYFYSGSLRPASSYYRDGGLSVRLVRQVD